MAYPATLVVQRPERVANWRPLVQWLLAIPHYVVLYGLNIVSNGVAVISWFAIVFTGSLPEGLANLQCMIIRYQYRTSTYATFLHESYPPFEFPMTPDDPGGTPTIVTLRPALTGRNRLTVGLRFLWIIPAALFAAVIGLAAGVVLVIGFFAVLFTGRWPQGLADFVVKAGAVLLRTTAYWTLLTDEYPPFALDET